MAASDYAYNTLKMPRPLGVITVPSDEKDAIISMDKMYQDAVAVEAAAVPAKEIKGKKRETIGTPTKSPRSVPPPSS